MVTGKSSSFFARNEFLIRRLHSLTGLFFGGYMTVHLLTNASVLDGVSSGGATADGAATFQNAVFMIHSMGSILPAVEWTLLFAPFLFHAFVGFAIIWRGSDNSITYPYPNNLRYTLQRLTGIVAFVFIMLHVAHMHGWFHFDWWLAAIKPLGFAQFKPYNAASTVAAAMKDPLVIAGYAIGVLACVYHLANGLWTAGITWGLWTKPSAQVRASYVFAVVGVVMTLVGFGAIGGFASLDVKKAAEKENRMYRTRVEAGMIKADPHKRSEHGEGDSEPKTSAAERTR